MTEDENRDIEKEESKGQQTSALMMKGATILVIAGIVSKIFGAIFRIPLTNMIGAEGQAYYSARTGDTQQGSGASQGRGLRNILTN